MNNLVYRKEFEQILANYKISPKALTMISNMQLVLLAGPSGVGRNTIITHLVQLGDYSYIVSDTTRKPRINNGEKEKNGLNYWFRNEEDFLSDLSNGQFLEAEIIHNQQVSGISLRELKKAYRSGRIAIDEVEIGGFNNILKIKPDALGIFVFPPNFNEWLNRLINRGQITRENLINRLETSLTIYKCALDSQQANIIINDQLTTAVSLINDLAHRRPINQNYPKTKQLTEQLYKQTSEYLTKLKSVIPADDHSGTLDY